MSGDKRKKGKRESSDFRKFLTVMDVCGGNPAMLAAATGESVTLSIVVSVPAVRLELLELERLLRVNALNCFSSAATAAIRLAVNSSRCCYLEKMEDFF